MTVRARANFDNGICFDIKPATFLKLLLISLDYFQYFRAQVAIIFKVRMCIKIGAGGGRRGSLGKMY